MTDRHRLCAGTVPPERPGDRPTTCGRQLGDEFLCQRCTSNIGTDLAWIRSLLPELTVQVTRQSRTSRHGGRAEPPAHPEEAKLLPAWFRTTSGPIALVATPAVFDVSASDVLVEVRHALLGWARDLCETRGLDLADELEKVAA